MYHHRISLLLPVLALLVLLASCGVPETEPGPADGRLLSANWSDTLSVDYAEGFRLEYRGSYKLLEVLNPYQDRTDTLRYVLRPRGSEVRPDIEGARYIDVPVRRMIATSTTHVGLTGILKAHDVLVGMVGAEYIYAPEVRRRLASGEIVSFPQGEFNMEQALAMAPDLVMVSAGQSSQLDDYRVLLDSGIGVLVNAEWLETTPLGKAEWMKVMGALLNREEMARRSFAGVEEQYLKLKRMAGQVENRPLVINNAPYKGAWFVSSGGSFTAQYLRDAGASYPWYHTEGTGGLRLTFERVYEVGLRADVWLNPGAARNLEELMGQDARFRDFRPVEQGRVYNNNRRMGPTGGNDFWESGVVHPERVLADLVKILHPGLLPGHELVYYRELEESR
ncbi:MAG: ABC transporter substrate-binding protein [Balneolaceae bacterium]|nr:ABC transporter substrate-binding protein [Balneolaceae bacterium]